MQVKPKLNSPIRPSGWTRNSYSGSTHFKANTNFQPSLWLLPAGGFLTPKKSRWAELAGARSWMAFSCSVFEICRIGGLWPFGLESLRHESIRCSPTNDPHQNWAARADCLAGLRVTTAYRWTAQRREKEREGAGGKWWEREGARNGYGWCRITSRDAQSLVPDYHTNAIGAVILISLSEITQIYCTVQYWAICITIKNLLLLVSYVSFIIYVFKYLTHNIYIGPENSFKLWIGSQAPY